MIRLWTRLTLMQRYTLVSAVIAIALAVVLSDVTVKAIESFAIKDEANVAAERVLQAIAPLQLQQADFVRDTLPPERRVLLDALFTAHGISDRALRVRLWRTDGRLLYSNAAEPEAVRTAAAGVDLSTRQGLALFTERQEQVSKMAPGVLPFFVPVQVERNAKPVAVFEIFYDLTHLRQQLGRISTTVWTTVPFGFLVLYTSVFVLVRRASRQLLKQQEDLKEAHRGTYESLASTIDAKDSYTGDHSLKVSELSVTVARALKLPAEMVDDVRIGARLHDLGKIGVPDAILMKSGVLNPAELVVMRKHAEGGFAILRKAPFPERVKLTVRHIHERWDGSGYPDGLAGEAIPLMARIIAVVDAYEALTSDRPYHKGLPLRDALQRLERDAGTHFDPRIAKVFVQLMRKTAAPPAPSPPAAVSQ